MKTCNKDLKTFSTGGVHPEENKFSFDREIESLPLPKQVIFPLAQHLGSPSQAIVSVGDHVKAGQLIAKATGFVSTNIHSSVSGNIIKIEPFEDISGYKKPAIMIEVEEDVFEDSIDLNPEIKKTINIDKKDIIQKILDSGIVGLGGATFPTHVKLSVPEGKKCEYLIINGVECEPYLTSDHRLMLEKGQEILIGIQILMKALEVDNAIIGIENNKTDAIKYLNKLAEHLKGITIQKLKVQYPQGAEKQLTEATVNRQIPQNGLPIDVGCVVHNVGTAYAVYEAVQRNKPLIERVVTITGKPLKNPSNYWVRIGTPISHLVEAAGGLSDDYGKIIFGGPMMGKTGFSLNVPVTKGTSGIVFMSKNESKRNKIINCIRCAKCILTCPLGLEPQLLMTLIEKSQFDQAEKELIMNCCECGSCQYSCPANRPLLDYIRLGKTIVGNNIRQRVKE